MQNLTKASERLLLPLLGAAAALIVQQTTTVPRPLTGEQAEILSHMSLVALDDGEGNPLKTIRFSGVNVQVVSGQGATNGNPDLPGIEIPSTITTNGLGNVIIGYNEAGLAPSSSNRRTGSHNLVLGDFNQYSSFGGIVSGTYNEGDGANALLLGGTRNRAAGCGDVIMGGWHHETTRGDDDSHSLTAHVIAGGEGGLLDGGNLNTLIGVDVCSITGGAFNAIVGGSNTIMNGGQSSVAVGGDRNTINESGFSCVIGGAHNTAAFASFAAILGGSSNESANYYSTVVGGAMNSASGDYSVCGGGFGRSSNGDYDWVAGGLFQEQ